MFLIDLALTQESPYQTRLRIDYGAIADLAEGLLTTLDNRPETRGLLQIPGGRLVDEDGKPITGAVLDEWPAAMTGTDISELLSDGGMRVQLTFGHRRRLAFMFLADGDDDRDEREEFALLPINLGVYTDQEMAQGAWRENHDREGLTAMEKARAVQRMMDDFRWTQKEVGKRLNLSRGVVSNLVRLLHLPVDWQEALDDGDISERQAMAILPATSMTQAGYARAEDKGGATSLPKLLDFAKSGVSSAQLRQSAGSLITASTCAFQDSVGTLVQTFASNPAQGVQQEYCENVQKGAGRCPMMIKAGGTMRCKDPDCFDLKRKWRIEQILSEASSDTGMPVIRGKRDVRERLHLFWANSEHSRGDVVAILKDGCDDMALLYDRRINCIGPKKHEALGVRFVCTSEKHYCECMNKRMQERISGPTPQQAEEKRRTDQARRLEEVRQQRTAVEVRAVKPAAQVVGEALVEGNLEAWRELYALLNPPVRDSVSKMDMPTLAEKIGLIMARCWRDPDGVNLTAARADIRERMRKLGLEVPWGDRRPGDPVGNNGHILSVDIPWWSGRSWCCPSCKVTTGEVKALGQLELEYATCPACHFAALLSDLPGHWGDGPEIETYDGHDPLKADYGDVVTDEGHRLSDRPPQLIKDTSYCPTCVLAGRGLEKSTLTQGRYYSTCMSCHYAYRWDDQEQKRDDDGEGLVYEQAIEAA